MAKGRKTGGRKAGTPNKATNDVRSAIAILAQNNIEKVQGWLERGARKNPLGAAKVFAAMLEYHVPKLQRTELTGKDGAELKLVQAAPHDEKL
jgi:hypothetical protein